MNVANMAASLFTPSTLKSLLSNDAVSPHEKLIEALRIELDLSASCTLSETINKTYSILRREGNRTDYVYRNAIIDKVVIGRHSINTATPIQEFRVGSSLADLVVLNGTSTVYEIKSERDTLRRLARQIENYSKVFERTYVVTSASKLHSLEHDLPEHVGIITLSRDYTLQTVREATTNWELIDTIAISRTMTIPEACAVLKRLNTPVPDVPNMLIRRAIDHAFKRLDARSCSQAFTSTLKSSRRPRVTQADITQVPRPLRSFALSHLRNAEELMTLLGQLEPTHSQSKEGL
ncbi:MAG: sce7726 family protein [Actinomyces sp.]|nr:sce7726 family protein [Actinomyces sp.]